MLNNDQRSALTLGQKSVMFIQASPARMVVIISFFLVLLTIVYNPPSLNWNTFGSLTSLTMLLSFCCVGQTFVLIGGGVDFTVGSVMSSTAVLTCYLMNGQDGRFFHVFFFAMLIGAVVGLFNGICVTKIELPPMIITVAIGNIITRLSFVMTSGSPRGVAAPSFMASVSYRIGGVLPSIVLYAGVIWTLVFFLLNRSTFGMQLYLVGNNPSAAALNGINVKKVKIFSYVLSGIFTAFTGMLGAGYLGLARCQVFDDYAFNSLIAVIIGGTSFLGGIGTYSGSIAGAFLLTVLSNLLTVLQLSQPIKNIVLGSVVVLLLLIYNRGKSVRQ